MRLMVLIPGVERFDRQSSALNVKRAGTTTVMVATAVPSE
jgi:hypothetical protein